MPIHLLAPELVHYIAILLLDAAELRNLRLVCKAVKDVVDPIIFHTIKISAYALTEKYLKSKVSLLEHLASLTLYSSESTPSRNSSASTPEYVIPQHVRTLKIGLLSPDYCADLPGFLVVDYQTIRECTVKFGRFFCPALESLVNVQRVEWTPFSKDLSWTHAQISNCLSQMQLLSEFSLIIDSSSLNLLIEPLILCNLNGLTKFSLICDFYDEAYASATAAFLARHTTSLRELRLKHTNYRVRGRKNGAQRDFDSLLKRASFPSTPQSPPSLRLDVLCLPSWTLTDRALPEETDFGTLTTLELGSMSDEGWRSLQAANVRVRCLHVDQASEALFFYLASYDSYEGLEEFLLDTNFPRDDKLFAYFYQDVLPKHEKSLRKIRAPAKWALRMSNVDIFNGCILLESLDVGFASNEIQVGSSSDIVAAILHFAASHPFLADLTLHPVTEGPDFNILQSPSPAQILDSRTLTGEDDGEKWIRLTKEAIRAARFVRSTDRKIRVMTGGCYIFEMEPGRDRFSEANVACS